MWVQTLRVKGKEFDHFARSLLSNILVTNDEGKTSCGGR
jgi:hypothetical protein